MSEWINVKDKLPLNTDDGIGMTGVIVSIRESDGQMRSGYRIFQIAWVRGKITSRWLYPWSRISDENITYWMPIPSPPKEDA